MNLLTSRARACKLLNILIELTRDQLIKLDDKNFLIISMEYTMTFEWVEINFIFNKLEIDWIEKSSNFKYSIAHELRQVPSIFLMAFKIFLMHSSQCNPTFNSTTCAINSDFYTFIYTILVLFLKGEKLSEIRSRDLHSPLLVNWLNR